MIEKFAHCYFHELIGQDSPVFPKVFFFFSGPDEFHLTLPWISFLIQNAGAQNSLGFSLILNLGNNH